MPSPLFPPAAAEHAFQERSTHAAAEAPELRVKVPHQMLREDVLECLERAAARKLAPFELAVAQRCFVLDAAALIGWTEFSASVERANDLAEEQTKSAPRTSSHRRLMAARRKGVAPPAAGLHAPLTSSQVGPAFSLP